MYGSTDLVEVRSVSGGPMSPLDDATKEALVASRALLAVVARSIAPELDIITIPQFRVLVVLSTAPEPLRHGELAKAIGVHQSTFTRTVDRLVDRGWVTRSENPESRRETLIELTAAGAEIVNRVTARRFAELRTILSRLAPDDRQLVTDGMIEFAKAAGEPSIQDLATLGL